MSLYRKIISWIKDEAASTSVEFAMIGLGFFTMMVGVIEVGRMAWTSNVIDYATDEAARYAILHQDFTSSDVETFAKSVLQDFFVPSASLSITVNTVSTNGMNFVEIEGNYDFETLSRFILPPSMSTISFQVLSKRPVYIYDESES